MLSITQGQRLPIANITDANEFQIRFDIPSDLTIDFACFGLDSQDKLSDERYMVFFNQPKSPCGGIRLADSSTFSLILSELPASIDKLVFTVAIDGAGTMSQIRLSNFQIGDGGQAKATCAFSGSTFQMERAIMLVELYRKDGAWRLNSILQGFNEGLDALVRHFGGEVAEDASEPAPTPAPPAKVSLEKRVAAAAPQLVSLAKKAQISLEKAKVADIRCRIGLILDASGSMNGQYKHGRVQEVVNRLLPMAVQWDDDGALDCWAFGDYPQQLSTVTLQNFANFIDTDQGGWRNWELGSRINTEWRVIEKAIDYYQRSGDRTPVFILFISDGGIHDSSRITRLIRDAAKLPIFWQFIGIDGRNYGILEKLDDLTGRVVDNCNFFALDDLRQISEEELYDCMMEEFPGWLRDAKAKGIVA
ncbi:tellurium resistance protein [Azotobacter chroococcum]|uniref:VWA domain-containing protein n=1 Tax=Azotobacter chroococcum TaxID=353 RepID=UPI001039D471|nr:VWA domain-containing protein [Azotobacter chroococcum]TBW02035.1 tellurium resistance protein [Azotobacter chroococcum]